MKSFFFVLGAPDPEMVTIETLAREAGAEIYYALGPGGARVKPGEAYSPASVAGPPPLPACGPGWAEDHDPSCTGRTSEAGPCLGAPQPLPGELPQGAILALVECALPRGVVPVQVDSRLCSCGAVWPEECDGHSQGYTTPIEPVVCDHHREGDPGFGKGPEDFLPASSLGQVISLLAREGLLPGEWPEAALAWSAGPAGEALFQFSHKEGCREEEEKDLRPCPDRWLVRVEDPGHRGFNARVIPPGMVLAAAGDHCPDHAYRGRCPGVEPDELQSWRAATRAAFQKRPVEAVLADVEAAREVLRAAPELALLERGVAEPGCQQCGGGGIMIPSFEHCWEDPCACVVQDPRWVVRDIRGSGVIPELPEAALREGLAYLAALPGQGLRLGAASPEQVQAFQSWAQAQGYGPGEIYGDQSRGFAGTKALR